jgi:hypothetical protein
MKMRRGEVRLRKMMRTRPFFRLLLNVSGADSQSSRGVKVHVEGTDKVPE